MTGEVQLRRTDSPFTRLFDWFEAPDVFHVFEGIRPFDDRIRLEEEVVGDQLVIRAEMPGIDPEKDVEISLEGDVLHISAERCDEDEKSERNYMRRELRYGSFRRDLLVPTGTSEADVSASYKDGILEIRVPTAVQIPPAPAVRIPVTNS